MRFNPRFFLALLLGCRLYASPISVDAFSPSATVVNFDDLLGGDCNQCGTVVTDQYSSLGVIFEDPSYPDGATVQTNLVFGIPNATAPNALFVFQGGSLSSVPADPFRLLFSQPVNRVGFDYASSADSYLQLSGYDSANNLIETLTFTGSPAPIGLGGFAGIESSTGIARLDVSYHPFSDPARTYNFSIDNVRFEAVPEPSTYVLTGIGLAAAGFLRFRRGRPVPGAKWRG